MFIQILSARSKAKEGCVYRYPKMIRNGNLELFHISRRSWDILRNYFWFDYSLVHTSDISISTRSIRKQSMTSPLGLANSKQREFFFVSPFVLLLAYAWNMILCLLRSLCRRLDFIPLFCLLFCPYAYAYAIVWTRLIRLRNGPFRIFFALA